MVIKHTFTDLASELRKILAYQVKAGAQVNVINGHKGPAIVVTLPVAREALPGEFSMIKEYSIDNDLFFEEDVDDRRDGSKCYFYVMSDKSSIGD